MRPARRVGAGLCSRASVFPPCPGSADGEITEQTLTGRVAIERVIGNTMETSSADMESYGVR